MLSVFRQLIIQHRQILECTSVILPKGFYCFLLLIESYRVMMSTYPLSREKLLLTMLDVLGLDTLTNGGAHGRPFSSSLLLWKRGAALHGPNKHFCL